MTLFRRLCCAAALAAVAFSGAPRAQGASSVVFHAIGGPGGSIVRDATRVGSTIVAVGTSETTTVCCGNPPVPTQTLDSALWTIDGANPPARTLLPNFAAGGGQVNAEAITADGAFVASQARSNTGTVATRYAVTGAATTNLNAAPYTVFTNVNGGTGSTGRAISNDGGIVYGTVLAKVLVTPLVTTNPPVLASRQRAARFDTTTGTSTLINPIAAPVDTAANPVQQQMLQRGASANGSVAVGFNFHPLVPVLDSAAFRYVNTGAGSSVTAIPRAPGGTWNQPAALSNDGNLTLLIGDSAAYPGGEVAIHNAATGILTPIGTPNSPWSLNGLGGISDDGSVVALSLVEPCASPCTPAREGYIHNSHGWFHLRSVLADGGVTLPDWSTLVVLGLSGDGTLLWGQGTHNGTIEGFVVDLAPNYLRNYAPVAVSPVNTSIVGVWAAGTNPVDPSNPDAVVAFLADGTYFNIEPSGFERGYYWFDGATIRIATLVDTNGNDGLSDSNGVTRSISVVGDELRTPAGCVPGADDCGFATRITGAAGSLVGGWVAGDPRLADSSTVVVFTASGKVFLAQDGQADGGGHDGVEVGTATWSTQGSVYTLQSLTLTTDTNGDWGLSNPIGALTLTVAANELSLLAGDSTGSNLATRIIDPATVAQVTGGSAQATLGSPFNYQVSATHAQGFTASGLPPGLGIDAGTGVIAGTPTVAGFFPVTVSATNTFGNPRTATVDVTVASVVVTSSGTGVSVAPEVPPDTPPVTMTFDTVTTAGTATVAVLDASVVPPPPSGFQVGDVPLYYEITTTASFVGQVSLCFSYAGVDFGGQTPRLFHYVNGQWVDVTTSVDAATQTLCGSTTSFSPFAIFRSPTPFVSGKGFYAPVSPIAGVVNASKAGSTVPLKFNVFVNGAEKTDTAGLVFSVTPVACTVAPSDPVAYVTQDSTGLRYDTTDRQFILNWKTPKAPGCYLARVTTADGLLIKAAFKLK